MLRPKQEGGWSTQCVAAGLRRIFYFLFFWTAAPFFVAAASLLSRPAAQHLGCSTKHAAARKANVCWREDELQCTSAGAAGKKRRRKGRMDGREGGDLGDTRRTLPRRLCRLGSLFVCFDKSVLLSVLIRLSAA